MKVNLQFELTDEQRENLCKHIRSNGKTNPLFSRKEVRELVTGFVDAVLEEAGGNLEHVEENEQAASETPTKPSKTHSLGFDITAPNGDPALKGKSPSYCRGWNQVKYKRGYKR